MAERAPLSGRKVSTHAGNNKSVYDVSLAKPAKLGIVLGKTSGKPIKKKFGGTQFKGVSKKGTPAGY